MKSTERHRLKGNEFADSVAKARTALAERQNEVALIVAAIVVVAVAAGGYVGWRANHNAKSQTLLAQALAVAEAPVVAPPAPAPGSAPPVQQPGTYRTDTDRLNAAVPKLQQAADAYPNTDAGITARFRLAGGLAELGRYAEAEQRYREVIAKAGSSSIYARTARLGLGEVLSAEGKTDEAIATYRELATDANSQLPLDGVLMQLGRVAMRGGKTEEATRAFTRVVDEFPQSLYAAEAKEKLQQLKKA